MAQAVKALPVQASRPSQFRRQPTGRLLVCLALWAALFLNLNTGPWLIEELSSLSDVVTFLRVYAAVPVLLVAALLVLVGHRPLGWKTPLGLLGLYGSVALLAGVAASPDPEKATYWSIAFLATVATCAAMVTDKNSAKCIPWLLRATWAATIVICFGVIYLAPRSIFYDKSAYFIEREVQGQIISSGVARWAAVAALVALVHALTVRGRLIRMLLWAFAIFELWIVYRTQSRGALFGTVAAVFLLLACNKATRILALCAILIFVPVLLIFGRSTLQFGNAEEAAWSYVKRGSTDEKVMTLSGRTAYWRSGWSAFLGAPTFGRGQWSDRLLRIGHIHNAFLQALLNGGLIGFVPFILSWVLGWQLFMRLWRKRSQLQASDQANLLVCGLLMAFFTVRSIPETTTASYSPDLMIMCAIYCYMQSLELYKDLPRHGYQSYRIVIGPPPPSLQRPVTGRSRG